MKTKIGSFSFGDEHMVETTFTIAVLPGDGIGPEVIREAVKVLRAVESHLPDVRFSLTEYPCGAAAWV
jgi:3-isopropylmalate dehydrogenase